MDGVGTIIAANYVAVAKVLHASFRQHHPDVPFFTVVIDGDEDDRGRSGLGTVLLPTDVIDDEQWRQMAAGYTVMELATAIKPWLLQHLLQSCRTATYLDPDIKLYAPISDCFDAAAEHAIALTPHCLLPVPRDGLEPSEQGLMLSGLFNLGYVSVGQLGRPFLRWWQDRLRFDAVVDVQNALFTDQRWVDWVPSLFDHTVLRDPGLNVAYWNAHERALHRVNDVIHAGAVPLRFFHFSGYDPRAPWQLSKHAATAPRVRLPENPVVQDLCAEYAADLERFDHEKHRVTPYRLDTLADGFRLTPRLRRLIREEQRRGEDVPDPQSDPAGLITWLTAPVRGTAEGPLNRWELLLWEERFDLQAAFPDPNGRDATALRYWFDYDAGAIERRQAEFGNRVAVPSVMTPSEAQTGWSLIAYADAELGVGEAGRRMSRAAQLIGLPTEVVGVAQTGSRRQHPLRHDLRSTPSYDNSITCVNADQLQTVWHQVGIERHGRRGARVGLWFWEVDRLPEPWWPAMALLDQVWVTSAHTKAALDQVGACPVELVRLPVLRRPRPTPHTRADLGLPEDRFVFLCSYDFFSVLRRKNPLDAVAAYTAAFGPDDGAALVLKSINGVHSPQDLDRVRGATKDRPDIVVLDGYVSAGEQAGLLELSDCLVSLHRSEGYGLNLIDAMAAGRPVVATGYSGNMSYMDEASAFLVPWTEVEVGPGAPPYPADARWAQPDLAAAAGILRTVFDDPAAAVSRGLAGQHKVLTENSLEVVGSQLRALTDALLGAHA